MGGKEWSRRLHRADGANHHADDSGDERALPQAIDAFRRFVILPVHSFFPPGVSGVPSLFFPAGGCNTFSRTSAGKSARLAFRLNSKARTYATMAQRSRGAICAEQPSS